MTDNLVKWWKLVTYIGDAVIKWRTEFPPTPKEPTPAADGLDEMVQGPDGVWRKKTPATDEI